MGSRASRKKGADPKPTPVRNVAKATEGLHLVFGASFGRTSHVPPAIMQFLRISREGWACEGKCQGQCKNRNKRFS